MSYSQESKLPTMPTASMQMCGSGYRENNHWETSQEKTHALRNEPEKLVSNKQRRKNHHSVLVTVLVTRTNSERREQTLESPSLIYMGEKGDSHIHNLKKNKQLKLTIWSNIAEVPQRPLSHS